MTVRLGFAVAAHLDCEILVVDEVLAVGDADFQKKCLGRMQHMQGDGRTVLFVSHQMSMISALCSRGVMLMNGQIFYDGDVQSAILRYQPSISSDPKHAVFDATKDRALQAGDKRSRLLRVWAESQDGVISRSFDRSDEINVCFDCELCAGTTEWPNANIHLFDSFGSHVFCVSNRMKGSDHEQRQGGNYRIKCNIPAELLNTGTYTVGVAVVYMSGGANAAFWIPQALSIHVSEDLTLTIDKERCGYAGPIPGPIRPILDWSIDRLEKGELSVGSEARHTSDQLN
jgi:lipopolysaccharide transport system ATP-binding protein